VGFFPVEYIYQAMKCILRISMNFTQIYYLYILIYIFFNKRGKDRGWGKGRRRGRGIIPSRLHAQCRARCGGSIPEPWDHNLGQNQESDAQRTEPPRHPGFYQYLFKDEQHGFELHGSTYTWIFFFYKYCTVL